jgi:hypothetical protein
MKPKQGVECGSWANLAEPLPLVTSGTSRAQPDNYPCRSIYRHLYVVEVGIYVDAFASTKRPSLHEVGSKTAKRYTAPEPVLTRYKLYKLSEIDS